MGARCICESAGAGADHGPVKHCGSAADAGRCNSTMGANHRSPVEPTETDARTRSAAPGERIIRRQDRHRLSGTYEPKLPHIICLASIVLRPNLLSL